MDFGIAETGFARCSLPGTTTEVLRFGNPFAEIRVVSTGQQRTHQDVHPSKNPPGLAPVRPVKSTGQTGVAWAARDEQHPRVNSPKSKSRSPESLHGLEQDFGDIRNTS
jgi:hypothetical protein